MKILYLTVPSFFDLEISLIRELKKLVNIKVVMIVSPESMHSSAFSIETMDDRCEIIPASDYVGMEKYKDMINLEDWYIANNPNNSMLNGICLACKIHKFYKSNGFTLFHSTTDCKTAIMHMPFAWMTKNTLYSTHDPISHKTISFIDDLLRYRLMFRSHKNLLLMSDALLEPFCARYNVSRDRIHFSRLSIYDFLQYYSTRPNEFGEYILFFGKIVPYKGVDVLIDAFLNSEERKKGVKLVIAGKGNITHNQSQLSDDIIFINKYIDNEELSNLIRHCKYVVLPYISATQSGCVMSAYAFNKPIVATSVGDLPKEIEDGVTGIICKPNNVEDLQIAIDTMGSADIEKMSTYISSKYKEGGEYSWTHAAKMIVSTYNEIIK